MLFQLSLLLRAKGQTEEAARLLRSATIYSEGHANQTKYLASLGETLFELERYENALKAFLSAESLSPGSAESWIRRCQIELGVVATPEGH